jgi:phage replication-related protein YjqB (UPF0714/DUF867 family)
MDMYSNFAELQRMEPKAHYRIRLRSGTSGVAVIALHGGGIERGTLEIARAVAGGEHTFYGFEGLRPKQNRKYLHITSTHFDEPQCVTAVQHADKVLAIHGCSDGDESTIYTGGLDAVLKLRIEKVLSAAGFTVAQHPDPRLQGRDPDNICNRGATRCGVQLELPENLRGRMFASLDRKGRQRPTQLFEEFVAALRRALEPEHF